MRPVVLIAFLLACATDPASDGGFQGTSRTSVRVSANPMGPPQLDLLFVIDNTTAMGPYQERMATLPSIVEQAYRSIGGGIVDMHIAVVSGGELRHAPGIAGSFITIRTEFDLARVTNFLGTLSESFGRIADVGALSTSPNEVLAGLQRIVAENPDGLLRDHAYLGIVIVSASDDASAAAPADYAQLITHAKADPGNVFIVGMTQGTSPRLDEFFAGFLNRHLVVSLADGDYKSALDNFNLLIKTILPGTCMHASDVDVDTPGPQYDCTFTVIIRGAERVLPPCKLEGDQFCWSLVDSTRECDTPDFQPVKPRMPPYIFFTFVPPFRSECVVTE